jgi:hypothetical protein
MCSSTPLLRLHWDDEPSGYAEIWIIEFFFENRLHWQFEVANVSTEGCFRLYIYLCANKTLMLNSLHVIDKWGEKFKP